MPAPYKRASAHGLLWIVIVFIGIGISIAIGLQLPKNAPWWLFLLTFGVPIISAILYCAFLTNRIKRQRISAIQQDLERDGFIVDTKPPAQRKHDVFAPIAALQQRINLQNGADGIDWLALNTSQPAAVCIFEHHYFTGSGKYTVEHIHTIYAQLFPNTQQSTPTAPSDFAAFRPYAMQRKQLAGFGNPITISDAAFDKHWLLFGDPATAAALLTSANRITLADSPKGESWHITPTWIACTTDIAMDTHNLAVFRKRAAEVVRQSGLKKT